MQSVAGAPFDSTPHDFDAQFFVESMLNGTAPTGSSLTDGESLSPYPGEFRLQSDFLIARDSRTACEWQSFVSAYPTSASILSPSHCKWGSGTGGVGRSLVCASFRVGSSPADIARGCLGYGRGGSSVESGPGQ